MRWFFRRCKATYASDGFYESKSFRCHLGDNHQGLHMGRDRGRLVLWTNTIERYYEER